MNHKKSMHIFWFTLCLLLLSGTLIIAVIQYQSHKKKMQDSGQETIDTHNTGSMDDGTGSDIRMDFDPAANLTDPDAGRAQEKDPYAEQEPAAGSGLQPASGTAQPYQFELRITDGYLDVYYYRTQQIYFHTGISYQTLSSAQKQDLENGKYFQNEQDLYGYLESCTS